jgi:small subunit ribosomal protein S4
LLENNKEFSRGKARKTPPGMHGDKRKRLSTYALQIREKQKIRFLYGLKEKQLYNLFVKLKNSKGNISDGLLVNCESRLDNILFRSGLMKTRRLARQLVCHSHFLLNGKKVKTPSHQIHVGDVITLKKNEMTNNKIVKEGVEENNKVPSFLEVDKQNFKISLISLPSISEIQEKVNISLILE